MKKDIRGFLDSIKLVELTKGYRIDDFDADIKNNPTVVDFYLKNGFTFNEKYRKKTDTVSMRLDIFKDV